MTRSSYIIFVLAGLVVAGTAYAEDLTSTSFILRNPTIDAGSATSSSTSFITTDYAGQNAPGESNSTSFYVQGGFSYLNLPVFTATGPSTTNYSAIAVSTSAQNSSATLSGVTVTNTRAITNAWSLTVNTTNLTITGSSSKVAGNNDTVTFSGTYNGVVASTTATVYKVEITTGGAVGAAIFKWTDPAGTVTTNVTTASNVSLNSGLSVNFGAATYVAGDKWIIRVDSLGYTSLTLQPGTPTVSYGDTGITSGSNGAFSGTGATSNARTLMSGAISTSNGKYVQNSTLTQSVHANTLQGTFSGTITITLS